MPESVFFRSTPEPLESEGFLEVMDQLGEIVPPTMSGVQMVTFIATILRQYIDPDDEETMERVVHAAIDTVLGCEAAVQLDLAVGPEDGIN